MEVTVEEILKRIVAVEEKTEIIEELVNKHINNEDSHLKKIRESYHNINDSLQQMKNPIIKVANGTERDMLLSDVISEVWSATYPLRVISEVTTFLEKHKFIKKVFVFILIFALFGLISTPVISMVGLINTLIRHGI